MNEHIRLRARVEKLEETIRQHENLIVRLMEQINIMQQQRKPGRPKKEPNGTI